MLQTSSAIRWLTIVALLAIAAGVRGESPTPRDASQVSRAEGRLLNDLADGKLDHFSLIQAALIASGVRDRETVESFSAGLTKKSAALPELLNTGDTKAKSAAIFDWLHRVILIGKYRSECSRLDQTLRVGDYNCVTATVLFHWLAKTHGLKPEILSTRSHVFSQVANRPPLRVETTCPTWFRDGKLASHISKPARVLSETQLLGKIYYNRGVALLQREQFSDAITMLKRSLKLDSNDKAAKENVLAAVNNWALHESEGRRFSEATALLRAGLDLNPKYPPFLANDLHIHQKWVLSLCQEGKFGKALEVLDGCHGRRPKARLFDEGRLAVYRSWALANLESTGIQAAEQVLAHFRRRFSRHKSFSHYDRAILKAAISGLDQRGRQDQARRMAQLAARRYPKDESIQTIRRRLTADES